MQVINRNIKKISFYFRRFLPQTTGLPVHGPLLKENKKNGSPSLDPSFPSPKAKRFFGRPVSLIFEISILYTVILGVILFMFSGVFYMILSRTLYTELDNELRLKAHEVGQSIRTYLDIRGETREALQFAVKSTITDTNKPLRRWWYIGFERRWFQRLDEQNLTQDFINFVSREGEMLGASPHFQNNAELQKLFLNDISLGADNTAKLRYITYDGSKIRVINFPFNFQNTPGYIVQVGISPAPMVQLLESWMNTIFMIIPVILILTSFVGWLLASRIIKPVRRITTAARNITYQDLSLRIEAKNYHAEMNSLIEAFNDMISRLERSFSHIEEFSAHVAHELKTPLTIIKGEAELALLQKRNPDEYEKALRAMLEEAEKMLRIVQDLLFLARMDYQPEVFHFERIDFNEFFDEITQQSRILAAKKDIQIKTELAKEKVFVSADKVHLRRLFFNIIDNAVKFTPEGKSIHIKIFNRKKNVIIAIKDQGPGISKENLDKVFDRFFRVDSNFDGHGLGLNIARTIAKLHKGEIKVESKIPHGTTFMILLPKVDP